MYPKKIFKNRKEELMKVIDKKSVMLLLSGISGAALSSAPKTVNADDNKPKSSNTVDGSKTDTTGSKKSDNKSGKVVGHTDNYKIVRVKSGDTTWDIAEDYNDKHDKDTSVAQIVEDNDLENGGSLIHVGQELKVRADDGKPKEANSDQSTSANITTQQTQQSSAYNAGSQVAQSQGTNQYYGRYQNYQAQNRTTYNSSATGNEKAAKEWIAMRESGGSYTARNASSGTYGRYQLTPDKLGGDTSPANQERVADQYVKSRYGSWQKAKNFWMQNHWY